MSKITVTNENVDKFVKRFHKIAGKELGKTLSESQELFAKSLGTKNYHELKQILESVDLKNNISSISNKTGRIGEELIKQIIEDEAKEDFDANEPIHVAKRFLNRLRTILHAPNSRISLAFYSSNTILLYSIYGDCYAYTFGEDHNLPNFNDFDSYSDKIQMMSQSKGLSNIDGRYLNFVFSIFTIPNITQMFYSKEIGESLRILLGIKDNKEECILKSGSINHIRIIDNKIYFANSVMLSKKSVEDYLKSVTDIVRDNNEKYAVIPENMITVLKYDDTHKSEPIFIEYYRSRSDGITLIKAT